jgi:beta-1,4-mannosyltransferase
MVGRKKGAPVMIACFYMADHHTYYFWLYYKALQPYGFRIVSTKGEVFSRTWLSEHRGKISILHFHWPSYVYSRKKASDFVVELSKFVANLIYARMIGYKIAWTVHNLYPHERNNRLLEYLARFSLAHLSHILFVHFEGARAVVKREFRRKKEIYRIPHGDFRTVFPNRMPRSEARERLGIRDDAYVYLVFGNIRAYKGIREVAAAFKKTASEKDLLLVVGKCPPGFVKAGIAGNDERVRVVDEKVSEEDVQIYFQASDCSILHYRRIFTSGNLFLSMGFAKPIIAVKEGILAEVVREDFGILYEDEAGLEKALSAIKTIDASRAARAALARLESFRWEEAARVTAEAYGRVLKRRVET